MNNIISAEINVILLNLCFVFFIIIFCKNVDFSHKKCIWRHLAAPKLFFLRDDLYISLQNINRQYCFCLNPGYEWVLNVTSMSHLFVAYPLKSFNYIVNKTPFT